MLGEHAFHFQLWKALIELGHQPFEIGKLVGIRQHQRQPWLDACHKPRGSTTQPVRGAQQIIDTAQHDPPRFGQDRFPGRAIEQLQPQIDFQAGDRFTDGRLTLAQTACGGAERTQRGNLGEGFQGFWRITHGALISV